MPPGASIFTVAIGAGGLGGGDDIASLARLLEDALGFETVLRLVTQRSKAQPIEAERM